MPKIGLIAPTEQVYETALATVRDLRLEDQIITRPGIMAQSIDVVRQLIKEEGIEVVITRGGTAELILRSDIDIPVVPINLSCQELSQAVFDAKNMTGLPRPRIALLSVKNMTQDVKLFAKVLGADLRYYAIEASDEIIASVMEQVKRDGADVVLGGIISVNAARRLGFAAMLLHTSRESIETALSEARNLAYAIELERARTRRFINLVNHLREGVVYLDTNGKVQIVNPAAETMLDRRAGEMRARHLDEFLPLPGLADCLVGDAEATEEVVAIGDTTLLSTIIPAHVGRNLSGAIVTLQETNRISQMDVKIRRQLHAKGLIAPYHFDDIIGQSPAIREAKRVAALYAASDSTILISGETGTGKELFAQSIHNASPYANGPFVAVNCAALPPSLLESELFGYEEGAFTGANRRGRVGLIELAHNGTLFLDEISEMDQYGQVRLLRFLQERQIMRLGGDKYLPVQVRVVAATNRDLRRLVAEGTFREDLFYRLRVLGVKVPPLRERQGDIVHITEGLLDVWRKKLGRRVVLAPEAQTVLTRYPWPGNVRELANVLENLVVAGMGKTITAAMATKALQEDRLDSKLSLYAAGREDFSASGREKPGRPQERDRILAALREADGNLSNAATLLGLHRSTLYRKMKKHRIRAFQENASSMHHGESAVDIERLSRHV